EVATTSRASKSRWERLSVFYAEFCIVADRVEFEVEVLPIEEYMHGSRIDLLHNTGAPSVDGRVAELHVRRDRLAIGKSSTGRNCRFAGVVIRTVERKVPAQSRKFTFVLAALAI